MVGYVVLHYLNYDITVSCIEKLLKQESLKDIEIVIVDNGSNNNSGDKLKKKYNAIEKVHIISTQKNLGFAKGNNIGYEYARNVLYVDIVVIMNNDIIIEDLEFNKKLLAFTEKHDHELIGPNIITLDGINQNPFRKVMLSNLQIVRSTIHSIFLNIIYSIPLINRLALFRSDLKKKYMTREQPLNIHTEIEMPVLHGACIIFNSNWVKNEKIAFVPETFLYGEEDILFEYANNHKYRTIYTDDLTVLHLEDQSTNSLVKTPLTKAKFLHKHSLHSYFVLWKLKISNSRGNMIKY